MIDLLLAFSLPLAGVAALCAAVAAVGEWSSPRRSLRALKVGQLAWVFLAGSGAALAAGSRGDWNHLFWSVHFPMLGLFAGSGLLLVGAWPRARDGEPPREAALLDRPSAPAAALAVFAGLGLLPALLLTHLPGAGDPPRATGRPLEALVEVARYGLGGPVPRSMAPEHEHQLERGLGHPPREVTVSLGSTGVAAIWILLFSSVALAGALVPTRRARRSFLLVAPIGVLLVLAATRDAWVDEGDLWRNEPRLVRAYGPTLRLAGVLATTLLAALAAGPANRARRRAAGRERGSSS